MLPLSRQRELRLKTVFNPVRPHELIMALGRVLRAAADRPDLADRYSQSQLLSAYSVARHLAAEVQAQSELLEWLRSELLTLLALAYPGARECIVSARDPIGIGDALSELLDQLGNSRADLELRERLHGLFAEMADREVQALARGTA